MSYAYINRKSVNYYICIHNVKHKSVANRNTHTTLSLYYYMCTRMCVLSKYRHYHCLLFFLLKIRVYFIIGND